MQGAILQQAVKVELQHSCMAEPPPKNESWKGNEAQKERIQDYVTPFLEALPEGGKLSLSKDFISTVLEKCYFTESARNGVRSYIRDHLLKAEHTSSHATRAIDLVAATENDEQLVTRDGAFFIANPGLHVRNYQSTNGHPEKAPLREEPVPILDEGDEEVMAEAKQSAFDKATAMRLFHTGCADQAALIEEADPDRWARVKEIYDEYAKEKSFRFEVGYHTSGIPGARLIKSTTGGLDTLVVNIKGSKFHGERRPNNEQGQKDIKDMIKKSASKQLASVARNAAAAEALAKKETTVEKLVDERFPAPAKATAADPRPPQPGPARAPPPQRARRAAPTTLSAAERWEETALDSTLEIAALARAAGMPFAASIAAMDKWRRNRALLKQHERQGHDYPLRHSQKFWKKTVSLMEEGLATVLDGNAPRYHAVIPMPPMATLGMSKASRARTKQIFRRAARRVPFPGDAGDTSLLEYFEAFVTELNKEALRTGFLDDAIMANVGFAYDDEETKAALRPFFCLDVFVQSGLLLPEGVVLIPHAFSTRWQRGSAKEAWIEYFGEGNVALVSHLAATAVDLQDARDRGTWEDSDSDSEEELASMVDSD